MLSGCVHTSNKTKTLTGPCIRTTSSITLIIAFTYVKPHIASIFEIKNFGMGPFKSDIGPSGPLGLLFNM